MFGQWKQRFRCLQIPIRLNLEAAQDVIVACACLHNLIKRHGVETAENLNDDDAAALVEPKYDTSLFPDTLVGTQFRRSIVNQYF